MTSRAASDGDSVVLVPLASVARRAVGLWVARAGVRVVALRAHLVTRGSGSALLRVARRAKRSARRMVGVGAVTLRAIGVACVRRNECALARVAIAAESRCARGRSEIVRKVTRRAPRCAAVRSRVRRRHARMTRRAFARDCSRVAVWRVARRARARGHHGVRRVRGRVARRAGRCCLRGVVRRVAAQAIVVHRRSLRRERRLCAVASNARLLRARDEVVWLVARQARVVARGLRPRRRRVTARARRLCSCANGVSGVAVEAAPRPDVIGVRRRELGVARRAVLRRDGRVGVRRVAVRARDARVNADGGVRASRARVTRNARRGRRRRECVTGQAIMLRALDAEGVRARRLRRVAFRAARDIRLCEAMRRDVVTRRARNPVFLDVSVVSLARAKLLPLRWDELRRNAVVATSLEVDEKPDDRRAREGRNERRCRELRAARHVPLP